MSDIVDLMEHFLHFVPLLYLAGLATRASEATGDMNSATVEVLTDGCAYGSLSMTSYTLGWSGPAPRGTDGDAPGHAPAPDVPADVTNM